MTSLAAITVTQQQLFELAGLPGGWLRLLGVLVLAGLCALVIWLYRREARAGAPLRLRLFLAGLRVAALVVLAAIWLEPVIQTYTRQTVRASVAVLVDASLSMCVADQGAPAGFGGESTRIARVVRLLSDQEHQWLRRLAAKNELKLYSFGARARAVQSPLTGADGEAAPLPPDADTASLPAAFETLRRARDDATDLGEALTTVLSEAGESPLAGIVILTDGGVNRGLACDDVAEYVRRYNTPIFTVGVGHPEEPPNLRIAALGAPLTTPLGDPLEIKVQAAANGVEHVRARLELVAQRLGNAASSAERVVATREVELGADKTLVDEAFIIQADQAGDFLYSARVSPLDGEAVTIDNTRQAALQVLDERLRVLLISGRPSRDYAFVCALLERDKSVNLSVWLQSADHGALRDGDEPIVELPRKPEELLAYDVIVLMDPDPRELDSGWAVQVRRLVDEFGGGLLLQAGPHYTSRLLGDERLADLIAMLPVAPDPDAEVRLTAQGAYRTSATPLEAPLEALNHPLLAFTPDAQTNGAIWRALPGAWWYLPVLREKPLAAVLLRHGSRAQANQFGQPILLAAQPVGAGRTAFLALDSTWRWRATAESHFNRFWIQTLRYLSQARRQVATRRGTIVLDRNQISVGEYVKVEARVLDERFMPWFASDIPLEITNPDGSTLALRLVAVPEREGWFSGRFSPDSAGSLTLRVPLPTATAAGPAGADDEALVKHMLVQMPDRELRSLRQRVEDLERLAHRTEGRYWPIEQAGGLPDLIADATIERPPVRGPSRALWDNGVVLSLLAVLLGTEWLLRRRNHLL